MPDKHEVGGSSPLEPTSHSEGVAEKELVFIENRIRKKRVKRTDN